MKITQFFDKLIAFEPIYNPKFDEGEDASDILFIAKNMMPCSSQNMAIALCYAMGFGVEKDLEKFEEVLLDALKYQDFRVYMWLISAYTNGLRLCDEVIFIPNKEEKAKELIDLSNPLVANYYNNKHGYQTPEEIEERNRKLLEERRLKEEVRNNIKNRQNTLLKEFGKLPFDEIEEHLNYLKEKDALTVPFLGALLGVAVTISKYVDPIYKLLLEENDEYQDSENLRYFPIEELMATENYEMALGLLKYCEDENCSLHTSPVVHLKEAECYHYLGNDRMALTKIDLALDDEDYYEEAHALMELIEKK